MILEKLACGRCDTLLAELYATTKENTSVYAKRFLDLADIFEKIFEQKELKGKDMRFFSAPGRTEIGGNHTDHQHGHVLAGSVNLDIIAAVKENNTKIINIKSDDYDIISVDLNQLFPILEEQNTTNALVRGICASFTELGYDIKGFDAALTSSVLKGSGLSSSAAFEVLIGTILNCLFCEEKESAIKIAQIGQYAENVFFGKPCGLMDQMASSVGGFVAMDFFSTNNPIVEKIPFDFYKSGYSLCITDTGGSHADLTPDYAAIPFEMKNIAKHFDKEVLRDVLEKDIYENIATLREKYGDRAVLRAIHFYDDDRNAMKEALALKNGDFDAFKKLIFSSGLSSALHLQNVYSCSNVSEQGIPLALAICEKVLGEKGCYRVQGGGFAGTIQAFVPNDMLELFREEMEIVFGLGKCLSLSIRPVGGIEIV